MLLACACAACAAGDDVQPTPAQAIRAWLNLQPEDLVLLPVAAAAPARWTTRPGVLELRGAMIVRPITREDLAARGLGPAEVEARHARARDRVVRLTTDFVEVHNHIIMTLPAGVDENQMSAFLMATGDYQYAEPDWLCYPLALPNDTFYGSQYAHQRTNIEPAWNLTTGSTGVTIAITDTGVVLNHEDLLPNLVPGANSASGSVVPQASGGQVNDVNGHGTHCAGIAAARGNNGLGIAGSGWTNRIMPIRVSDIPSGSAPLSSIQSGTTWAAQNGARIVSTSYSGVANASNQTVGLNIRLNHDALWFWAAGNDDINLGGDAYHDLQIVGSTDSLDQRSGFSNYGYLVDIVAPGTSILSTYVPNANSYAYLSGTSMACPNAAGAAALILSVNPRLDDTHVRDLLFDHTDDLGAAGDDEIFGLGRINVGRSVAAAYRMSYPFTTLPFEDDFESVEFLNDRWVYRDTGVTSSTGGVSEPSGSRSANVNLTRRLESNAINLNGNVGAYLLPSGATTAIGVSIAAGQQAGWVTVGGQNRASVWSGTPSSWLDLHPAGASRSQLYSTTGSQQVGFATVGGVDRASLWSGSAASWVDLHPAGATQSECNVTDGITQGGYARIGGVVRASLWTGSAGSRIDLNPAGSSGSEVWAISGNRQAGYAFVGGVLRASIWSGSAASWDNLHPAGATESQVYGMYGNEQVGHAKIGGAVCASLWHGTGSTWVNLHPAVASESVALATNGIYQVGWANVGGVQRACIWTGSSGSYEDLAVGLQGDWSASTARGVWSDATTVYIVGYGFNDDTNRYEAVLWTRPVSADRVLTYATQARGPAAGESLIVEYLNNANQWINLQTVPSTGVFESSFTQRSVVIPSGSAARHPRFAVRFRASGNSSGDNWYIDDVRVGLPLALCAADVNGDGELDILDFLDFIDAFGQCDGQPAPCTIGGVNADFNGDTSVDVLDFLDFIDAFGTGCD